MSGEVLVPISIGELFDKISILEIKSERLSDEAKLANVDKEMGFLKKIAEGLVLVHPKKIEALFLRLKKINTGIWEAEDKIRDCERLNAFDDDFLATARSIYRLNDERASVKRELSILTSSAIIEEKSYVAF
jgi:hypothetical protein